MFRLFKAWFNRTFRKAEIDLRLKSLEIGEGRMDMKLQSNIIPFIAAEATQFFRDAGGINQVTFTVFDQAELTGYDVIIQKRGRPDMAAVNSQLRTALEDIETTPQSARAIAHLTLKRLGYKDQKPNARTPTNQL